MTAPRVLLTGADGFIGRAVASALGRRGIAVEAAKRDRCDLLRPDAVRALVGETAPTHVVHLAATGLHPQRSTDAFVAVENVAMMANLVAALAGRDVVVVASGSVSEYGVTSRADLREDGACEPVSPYAIGKLAATHLLLATPSIDGRVARVFGVYGPGEAEHRLFPFVLDRVTRNEPALLSDGAQERDFVQVDDVADALVDITLAPSAPRLLNVGTGVGLSVARATQRVCRAFGGDDSCLRFGARPRNMHDADRLVADTSALEAFLGRRLPQRLLDDSDSAVRAAVSGKS